jgi:hypothetical protein
MKLTYFSNSGTLLHNTEDEQLVQRRHSLTLVAETTCIQYQQLQYSVHQNSRIILTLHKTKDIICSSKQEIDSSFLGIVLKSVAFMK